MYEVVLGRPVDKSGFRTRMCAASFLKEAGYVAGESNRPTVGYRLVDRRSPAVFPRTFSSRGGDRVPAGGGIEARLPAAPRAARD